MGRRRGTLTVVQNLRDAALIRECALVLACAFVVASCSGDKQGASKQHWKQHWKHTDRDRPRTREKSKGAESRPHDGELAGGATSDAAAADAAVEMFTP
jgi:hypothetical protein